MAATAEIFPSNVFVAPPSTPADKAFRLQTQAKHARQLWYFIGCIIGFMTIIRGLRRLLHWVFWPKAIEASEPPDEAKVDMEKFTPHRTGKVSLRHFPDAVAAAFRIVFFRITVPIGPKAVASLSELTFILGYMAAILMWLFVDCK